MPRSSKSKPSPTPGTPRSPGSPSKPAAKPAPSSPPVEAPALSAPKPQPARSDRGPLPTCPFTPEVERKGGVTVLTLRVQIKRHDGRRILVSPEGHDLLLTVNADGRPVPKPYLVSAIGQAFAWHEQLMKGGTTIDAIAKRCSMTEGRVRHLLDLTRLSPAVLKAVLTGTLAPSVTLLDLMRASGTLDWSLQEAQLRI